MISPHDYDSDVDYYDAIEREEADRDAARERADREEWERYERERERRLGGAS